MALNDSLAILNGYVFKLGFLVKLKIKNENQIFLCLFCY